jgi:hypothetical protein
MNKLVLTLLVGPAFAAALVLVVGSGGATGGPFPPAGSDTIPVTGQISVVSRLGSETFSVAGSAVIQHGTPYMDGSTRVVDTEITSLSLTGNSLTGPVTITERATAVSAGQLRSLQTFPDFPASSFFDVFAVIAPEISGPTPPTVQNNHPFHFVAASVGSWPPAAVAFTAQIQNPAGADHCDATGGIPLLPGLPANICVTAAAFTVGTPATPSPTPVVTKQPEPVDSDLDGCSDQRESGTMPSMGGLRNFLSFWDFFDVWTSSGGGYAKTRAVDLDDIFGVAMRVGSVGGGTSVMDALATPASPTGYHAAYDRSFAGPKAWNSGAANGVIDIDDVFYVAGHFAHNCN